MRPTSKELGDEGEEHACRLLRQRGYDAELLRMNARTYDIAVTRGEVEFLVSVKVSRKSQHVRLGSRRAVLGLQQGNFVFAYMPLPGACAMRHSMSGGESFWLALDPGTP